MTKIATHSEADRPDAADASRQTRPRGRPKGSKNKVSKEARSYFLKLWRDVEFRKKFKRDWVAGKVPPNLMVAAAHYAFGKPVEQVNVNGDTEPQPTAFVLVVDGKALTPGADGNSD